MVHRFYINWANDSFIIRQIPASPKYCVLSNLFNLVIRIEFHVHSIHIYPSDTVYQIITLL